ncbi:MAG: hypothetical protein PVG97_11565 [Syntrophobacterales bacterium]|jgi:hypothetical protein
MPEDMGTKKLAVALTGLKPGTVQEDLVTVLQRLYPRQTARQIREALGKLPLLLARSATEEQARKLKRFLESKGAILKFSYSSQPAGSVANLQSVKSPGPASPHPPEQEKLQVSPTSQMATGYTGVERRAKPRVHPGIQIHPMDIGEILDRAFRLLRQHFSLFFFIILLPQGTFFLIQKGIEIFVRGGAQQEVTISMGVGYVISFVLALLIFVVLQFWSQGALIHAVSETYLGHETSFGASFGAMRSRLGRLLGTMFLMGLLLMLVPALTAVFMTVLLPVFTRLGGGLVSGLLSVAVVITAIVLFFHLLLNWLLVDKVVVLEGKGWRSALRRSKELMNSRTEKGFWKGPKNKAGLILLLGFLIGGGIHMLFQAPGLIARWVIPSSLVGLTLQEILNVMATSLAAVYTAVAMILYYYDIRLRSEGFDLKMMAEHL